MDSEQPSYRPGGLPREAFEEIDGEEYPPVVPASVGDLPELTFKAVLFGVFIAIAFGAANAYLGLKVGITVSASIPAAVMAVAFFKLIGGRGSLLEVNMVQTVGSAGESLAAGVIFTLPALFMWGLEPSQLLIITLAALGGLLGVLFMIPLRRYLIVKEHGKLIYPEGTACGQVITTAQQGGPEARLLFAGLGIGALYQALANDRFLGLFKSDPEVHVDKLGPNFVVAGEATPELLGVGFIIGPRIASIMLAGGILGWWVLIPLISHFGDHVLDPVYPETVRTISEMSAVDIWSRYVRYIGVGAVAFGGLATLVKALPTIVASFRHGLKGLRRDTGNGTDAGAQPRTQLDLDFRFVLAAAGAITVAIALLPRSLVPVGITGAIAVTIFSFFFVTVSSRIVGLVGQSSNPVSGMTIATLLITSTVFVVLSRPSDPGAAELWADVTKVGVLGVGALVCMAAAVAGDTSQDLKTGFLVGATPRRQQLGEIIGVLAAAAVMGFVLLVLNEGYGFGETGQLAAPQATLMKLVVEGILGGNLSWNLILTGVFIGLIVEMLGLPTLALAVGLYLKLALTVPIMFGGAIRWWLERRASNDAQKEGRRERGILFSSGLIAGAALVGVIIGGLVFAADFPGTSLHYACRESPDSGATPAACVEAFAADLMSKRAAVEAAEAALADTRGYLDERRVEAADASAALAEASRARAEHEASLKTMEKERERAIADSRRLSGDFKMKRISVPDPEVGEDGKTDAPPELLRAEAAWLRAEKKISDLDRDIERTRKKLVELIGTEEMAAVAADTVARTLAGAESTAADSDITELRVGNAHKKLDDARSRLANLQQVAEVGRDPANWSCFDVEPDPPAADGTARTVPDLCATGGGWLYSIQALTHGAAAPAGSGSPVPDLVGILAFLILGLLLWRAAKRKRTERARARATPWPGRS